MSAITPEKPRLELLSDAGSTETARQVALPRRRSSVVLVGGAASPPPPFQPAPLPPNEAERQRAVDALALEDTDAEADFDDVVALASRICGTPTALLTLLSHGRQWFKSAIGMELSETSRDVAFCGHAILGDGTFVIDDATQDPRFAGNPLVTGDLSVRFYAGVPVAAPGGEKIGTLCVLAPHPRTLSAEQQRALAVLARQIENQLSLRQALRAQLKLAREKQELTDLVIHDLKSPLASIAPNALFIRDGIDNKEIHDVADDIVEAAGRLQRMVLDVLDTSAATRGDLRPVKVLVDVHTLLHEVQAGHSNRSVVELVIDEDVGLIDADNDLLRRVLDNLVDNAVKYGGEAPVQITARRVDGAIEIAVRDQGGGIAVIDRERVFSRGQRLAGTSIESARQSRGLGLRFCALAIEAHGGRIWVEDNAPRGTAFFISIAER